MTVQGALEGREQAWVVKGRADRNDFKSLRVGRTERWVTHRPPKMWLVGDLVFLWESAPALSVCAIAEITRIEAGRGGVTHFDLRYLSPYLAGRTPISKLRSALPLRTASFLKAGPAGTVFPLTNTESRELTKHVQRANPQLRISKPKRPSSTKGLALSVRQPWAELIMRGTKTEEYRTFTTHKRGRIWVYASISSGPREEREQERRALKGLPIGVVIGSVEIVGSRKLGERDFAWVLRRPIRLKRLRTPTRQPQPSFFRPF